MDDILHVSLPSPPVTLTKRGILAKSARMPRLVKVYDPLRLVSPEGRGNKSIDIPFPEGIAKRWLRRKNNAPDDVYFPRSPVQYYEPNDSIKLPAFGDASNHGVCAVVYLVVAQVPGVTQGLIAAKSRLTRKSLTISRWELVLGPIAVNLSTNVRAAREGFNMTEDIQ